MLKKTKTKTTEAYVSVHQSCRLRQFVTRRVNLRVLAMVFDYATWGLSPQDVVLKYFLHQVTQEGYPTLVR